MPEVLYVYAIGRELDAAAVHGETAVDGSSRFEVLREGGLDAVYSGVDAEEFSQEAIDLHSRDLQWLGAIGLSHQRVNQRVAKNHAAIPLRAFTLFASSESLRDYLREQAGALSAVLEQLQGKSEWTFRVDLDAERWNESLVRRVAELRTLVSDIEGAAGSGRAYLLKKKLDDARRSAARTAEEDLLREVADEIQSRLSGPVEIENRERRNGSFPQVNALVPDSASHTIRTLERELNTRYSGDGVTISVTGPWPPYSFAAGAER